VSTWETIAADRTDLDQADIEHVGRLISSWGLIADVSMADLVLWLPTWNSTGFVAAALVRPTTASTSVPDDVVGQFVARRSAREFDQVLKTNPAALGRGVIPGAEKGLPVVVPVLGMGRTPIAVIQRHPSTRAPGIFDVVYGELAATLLGMVAAGVFPPERLPPLGATDAPRVGDGLLRLGVDGRVVFASPNAASGFRRLGLATDLVGADLARTAARLVHRPGPVPESLTLVAAGAIAGEAELGNESATLVLRSWPLSTGHSAAGAIVLARDVTDSRAKERGLLSKDAAVREVHHRVKNNLQTVSALLRLQSRRVVAPEAQAALAEAGRRVAAIASVHDILSVEPGDEISVGDVLRRLVGLSAELAAGLRGDQSGPQIALDADVGPISTDVVGPLAMAVSELLANAVEHADATMIAVQARAIEDGSRRRLRVEVVDDGTGFEPDSPERGEQESSHDSSTGGLGLTIVRMLIEEDLNGHVTISRGESGGTRAVLEVPLVPVKPARG
jgi:two-component sensor histidine kinase